MMMAMMMAPQEKNWSLSLIKDGREGAILSVGGTPGSYNRSLVINAADFKNG